MKMDERWPAVVKRKVRLAQGEAVNFYFLRSGDICINKENLRATRLGPKKTGINCQPFWELVNYSTFLGFVCNDSELHKYV